ncbi:HlyC/CorC family transporter [Legionella israelensis]|uniref:hemolysin family protein n=1 Tax=Legionella israelensis TaxID=454 RepID=UPI0011806AB5|nr:hemolysin family protein [Legionella israelensis]QDP71614.1 HlyC/CorC family transporter [Legionella israelensis]
MSHFFLLLAAIFFVLLNAFFVAAEFGMVKLRHTRVKAIEETYGLRGRILVIIHQNLDAYLSACQLGITLASLALGWIGEPAFAHLISPILRSVGITSANLITVISVFVAFSLISFLHIVIGELMPKSLAIRQSEKISLWTAVPLYAFYWLMYPAILLLNSCSNFLLKLTKLSAFHPEEHFYSTEEIKLILSANHLHGELSKEQVSMLEHTLDFAELRVTEVMRPKEEMILLNVSDSLEDTMDIIMKYRYSRYPVYDPKEDAIIGIIHVKDLFSTLYHQGELKDLSPLIRPVLKISRRLPVSELLQKFREEVPHFALIYNRRGSLIGFVTLDNLLQVLIGRIKDEFHLTQEDWVKNPDGSISIKGDCSVYSLERALDEDIELGEEEEDIDTVYGLITHRLGALPKQGERVEFKEFSVVINKVQGSRIRSMVVYPKKS